VLRGRTAGELIDWRSGGTRDNTHGRRPPMCCVIPVLSDDYVKKWFSAGPHAAGGPAALEELSVTGFILREKGRAALGGLNAFPKPGEL